MAADRTLEVDKTSAGGEEHSGVSPRYSDHRLTTFLGPNFGKVLQKGVRESCPRANGATIGVARLTRLPHATIHMLGRLKRREALSIIHR